NVTSVKDGSVRRTSSVERVRREALPMSKPIGAARIGEGRPARGPGERWQGNQMDKMVRGTPADRRPQRESSRKPAFRGHRGDERPRMSEQRGPTGGPARPSGDRARTAIRQSPAQGRTRPDAGGARAEGREPVYGEKRFARPAFGGKVYGSRKRGPVDAPGLRPGGQKRPRPKPSGQQPANSRGRGGRRP
ncbi:MAG: hypothetical protein H6Q98_147, partial [Nitrospirae bacterium]|nr:hypothetical protein [Nitrospirota bacterium]